MPIQSHFPLENARRAIRKALVLEEDDPVDLITFASILSNFAPGRDVPVWLVIVGSPASGKTELISLLQDWRFTWTLPDVITPAYFFSAKTGHQSALERLHAGEYRILYSQDMGGLMGINRLYASDVMQQLRGIHDGFLRKETGFNSQPQTYGQRQDTPPGAEPIYTPIEPTKRLGWLGSATPEFYAWQAHHTRLGTRFMCYLFEPFPDWTDHKSLTRIEQQRSQKRHWIDSAKRAVHSFLDQVLDNLDGYEELVAGEEHSDRVAAAVKLVSRVIGTRAVTDTGARLHARVVAMCRMMAFMRGGAAVADEDVDIGLRIVMSQLPFDEHRIVRYALAHRDGFAVSDLLRAVGLTRRQVDRTLENMLDVGVFKREAVRGGAYRIAPSADTLQLARVFGRVA